MTTTLTAIPRLYTYSGGWQILDSKRIHDRWGRFELRRLYPHQRRMVLLPGELGTLIRAYGTLYGARVAMKHFQIHGHPRA